MKTLKKFGIVVMCFVFMMSASIAIASEETDQQILRALQDIQQILLGDQEPIEEDLGSVAAVGGICDGSEPTTQLCNVNAYELESQTSITLPASGYLYMGGGTDYGIRDNSGTVECKDSGGGWAACQSTAIAGGGWMADGNNAVIFPTANTYGDPYPLCIGDDAASCTATSTCTGADTTTSICAVGDIVTNDELYAAGITTLTGNVSINGGALTYNEDGADLDARFEGNGHEYLLFLDASTNFIGISSSTPYVMLSVSGDIAATNIIATGTLAVAGASTLTGNATAAGTFGVTGATTLSSTLIVAGVSTFTGNVDFAGTASTTGDSDVIYSTKFYSTIGAISFDNENLVTTGTLTADNTTINGSLVVNEAGEAVDFRVESDTQDNMFLVDGDTNFIGLGTSSPDVLLQVGSTTPTTVSGYNDAMFSGAIEVDGAAQFDGAITAATTLAVTGVSTLTDDLIVDTDTLFVDNSADSVGISSSTPTAMLAIGDNNATSSIAGGFFCQLWQDEAGRPVWITLEMTTDAVFATSTTPCE